MSILIFNIALALLLLAALVGVARPYGGRWGRMHFAMLAGGLAMLLLVMGGLQVTEKLLGSPGKKEPVETPAGIHGSPHQPETAPGQIV